MTIIAEAYRKYSTKRFPLPSQAQLEQLEIQAGVTFPEDYRRFVLEFNGGYFNEPEITPVGEGCPLDNLEILFGIGASNWAAELGNPFDIALFDDNNSPQIMPIGRTAMAGSIILDVAPGDGQGAIFLKKAFGDFYYLTESIEEFVALLREPTLT